MWLMCVAACDGEMKRGEEWRGGERKRKGGIKRRNEGKQEIERGVKVLYAVLTLYWGSPRLESQ